MTSSESPAPEWKWTQVPTFTHPEHPEWDVIQWDCEDELVRGPRAISTLLENVPGEMRYMKTKEAPGLQHLPPVIVLFRIVEEPSELSPGIILGLAAWEDDDLMTALTRAVQGLPTF
jgi:hypothetical protein